jgi:hypothetical protein
MVLLIGVITLATRWPFRSHWLFSWDSANYALALARIDIGAHRPHPPGYLGYVLAARGLNTFLHDPNLSLVLWNVVATLLSALVLAAFARQSADREKSGIGAELAPVAILLFSPLLWFYGEVAEIYPSELLVSLLVAYTAWRAVCGHDRAIYWCTVALAAAVAFKVTAAILMLPVVGYAWTRVPTTARRRSIVLLGTLVGALSVSFLAVQPDLPLVLWRHFMGATSSSRLVVGVVEDPLRTLNRSLRSILIAGGAGLGPVNAAALLAWAFFDRTLPAMLDRRLAVLWLGPWLLEFVFIHIGKPGYMLPLLPLACLVVGNFYVRQRPAGALTLVVAQAVFNIAYFTLVTPASQAAMGGSVPYREKTLRQRAASDLQALTFPTAFTIAQSDARVEQLLTFVTTSCPTQEPIVIAGIEPVDWRRVMWYLPSATAVHINASEVAYIARHTDFTVVPRSGVSLSTACPVIWLAVDEGHNTMKKPSVPVVPIPHLGWTTAPGSIRVSPESVVPELDRMSPR